ncbi:MAG TPA: ribonuclease HI family protein [Candidatus Omnitrophica bacterium]|nr:ribonuclease HI family protein [Candidatus Omnitrophota bacterium]
MKQAEIFIDGASKGNPGPSGIGVTIKTTGGLTKEYSKYIGETTNNVAEYSALIFALEEALILHLNKIKVNTDSELLYRQIKGVYRVRSSSLLPYYKQAIRLIEGLSSFDITHINREYNKCADKLATSAVKNKTNALGNSC